MVDRECVLLAHRDDVRETQTEEEGSPRRSMATPTRIARGGLRWAGVALGGGCVEGKTQFSGPSAC